MKGINYKKMIVESIRELQEVNPELSFAELLYSFLRKPMLKKDLGICNLGNLCGVTDEEIFSAIERCINFEEQDLESILEDYQNN